MDRTHLGIQSLVCVCVYVCVCVCVYQSLTITLVWNGSQETNEGEHMVGSVGVGKRSVRWPVVVR